MMCLPATRPAAPRMTRVTFHSAYAAHNYNISTDADVSYHFNDPVPFTQWSQRLGNSHSHDAPPYEGLGASTMGTGSDPINTVEEPKHESRSIHDSDAPESNDALESSNRESFVDSVNPENSTDPSRIGTANSRAALLHDSSPTQTCGSRVTLGPETTVQSTPSHLAQSPPNLEPVLSNRTLSGIERLRSRTSDYSDNDSSTSGNVVLLRVLSVEICEDAAARGSPPRSPPSLVPPAGPQFLQDFLGESNRHSYTFPESHDQPSDEVISMRLVRSMLSAELMSRPPPAYDNIVNIADFIDGNYVKPRPPAYDDIFITDKL